MDFMGFGAQISRPVPELLREHGARYVLLDETYATPDEIGMGGSVTSLGRWAEFALYEFRE